MSIQIGHYHVIIGAYGDIRACINGNYYCDKCNGGCFAQYLEEEGIHNDYELSQAFQQNKIEWENNNWYEAIIWDDKNCRYIDTFDAIIDDLDADDDFKWVHSWLKNILGLK